MRNLKNLVDSFDMFVRLDEQLDTTASDSFKMLKSKLKSASYNASSAISLMEGNPGVTIEPYIIAKIAVAADYLDSIEEYFRNYEAEGASMTPAAPMAGAMDMSMPTEETPAAPEMEEEMAEEGEEETPESTDDETEDEIEDSPEEE